MRRTARTIAGAGLLLAALVFSLGAAAQSPDELANQFVVKFVCGDAAFASQPVIDGVAPCVAPCLAHLRCTVHPPRRDGRHRSVAAARYSGGWSHARQPPVPASARSFAAVLVLALPGLAAGDVAEEIARETVDVVFSEVEREVIRDYYGGHPEPREREKDKDRDDAGKSRKDGGRKDGGRKGLPPGLAKKDALPPGLQRQLERNGRLPPGLEKRALPDSLDRRLPRPPQGHERVIVDRDVVLVETATGIIRDIVRDVLD